MRQFGSDKPQYKTHASCSAHLWGSVPSSSEVEDVRLVLVACTRSPYSPPRKPALQLLLLLLALLLARPFSSSPGGVVSHPPTSSGCTPCLPVPACVSTEPVRHATTRLSKDTQPGVNPLGNQHACACFRCAKVDVGLVHEAHTRTGSYTPPHADAFILRSGLCERCSKDHPVPPSTTPASLSVPPRTR